MVDELERIVVGIQIQHKGEQRLVDAQALDDGDGVIVPLVTDRLAIVPGIGGDHHERLFRFLKAGLEHVDRVAIAVLVQLVDQAAAHAGALISPCRC
jgi:hypothetical protein